jgi:hypothetical protein
MNRLTFPPQETNKVAFDSHVACFLVNVLESALAHMIPSLSFRAFHLPICRWFFGSAVSV